MTELARYLRTHVAGANAGEDLFERGARELPEPAAAIVGRIHREILDEKAVLERIIEDNDYSENVLSNVVAKVGEKASRLKPSSVGPRTAMTDFVDLETMRVALSGKLAGFEALVAIADAEPSVDRLEFEQLVQQARRQLDEVCELHRKAAPAGLLGRPTPR